MYVHEESQQVGMEVPNKQENAGESFTKKMAKLNFDNKLINEHK